MAHIGFVGSTEVGSKIAHNAADRVALALANGTQYALLGSVWTADVRRAHRLAAQIQAG